MSFEISKSEFKAKALEVLRSVEDTGQPVLITDRGIPTVELRRYKGRLPDAKKMLKDSVLAYDCPEKPTGETWGVLR